MAALPYPYDGALGRRAGYFNPSNILRDGDYLYAFVFAEAYRASAAAPASAPPGRGAGPVTGGRGTGGLRRALR